MTKILAITGTIFVWFPLLAPVLLSLVLFINRRVFRFDFLMPAELFLAALLGGGLLFLAARRQRFRYKMIGWSLAVTIAMLVASQALAVITGLASGDTAPGGWQMVLVLVLYAIFCLALIMLGIGGVLLIMDIFRKTSKKEPQNTPGNLES